jgi:large subunit ribosomal protein L53
MLKFLSKVVVEYCPLDPRKAAAVELVAQCNGRKAKDSNPACSVELRRLPSPPLSTDPKSQPTLPPPRVLVTYLNGAEEAIIAAEGATAQGIRDQILARGRLIDTEQMFRDGGEKWPVLIPKEELGMSFPGIKVRHVFPFVRIFSFRRTPCVRECFFLHCIEHALDLFLNLLCACRGKYLLCFTFVVVDLLRRSGDVDM